MIGTGKSPNAEDLVASGPPIPPLTDARKSAPKALPRPSSDTGSRAASMMGASPTMDVMRDMMQIEKLVRQIALKIPAIQDLFAPAIAQGRDIVAGGLASLVSGGSGAPDAAAGVPGSPLGGAAQSAMAGAGGGPPMPPGMGGGGAMMPPPPMM